MKTDSRAVLAVMATLLFIASYMAPWFVGMPKGADQYIGQAQGALIGQWVTVMGWYFGGSKGGEASKALAAQAIDKLPPGETNAGAAVTS